MFTFEVSAIDLVLLVAVVVLFALFAAQKKSQRTVAEPRLPMQNNERFSENPETNNHTDKKKPAPSHSPKGFQECVHNFGYLKNLPQNTAVPDECFGCPKVMRCLFPNEQTQQVH